MLFLNLQTDPFKVKTGGMVNMKALKSGAVKKVDDAYDVGIGTQFSAETNKRDEDEEMWVAFNFPVIPCSYSFIVMVCHF